MYKRLKQNRGRLPISAPSTAPDHRQCPRTGIRHRRTVLPITRNGPIPRTAGVSPAFLSPIMQNEPNSQALWNTINPYACRAYRNNPLVAAQKTNPIEPDCSVVQTQQKLIKLARESPFLRNHKYRALFPVRRNRQRRWRVASVLSWATTWGRPCTMPSRSRRGRGYGSYLICRLSERRFPSCVVQVASSVYVVSGAGLKFIWRSKL